METLFTTPLNHPRFDDYHWFFAADLHENLWKLDGFQPIWHGNFIYYPPESSKIWWCSLIVCCWFAWTPMKTWWFSCNFAGGLYLLPSWITKDLVIVIDFLLLICMKTYEDLMAFMQISWGTLFTTLLNHQRLGDFHWFDAVDLMMLIDFFCISKQQQQKKGQKTEWLWMVMMMHDGGWWWWWW